MRHSKRDYLTQQDIKLALKKLNFGEASQNLILGYPSHVPFQYVKMGQSGAAGQGLGGDGLGADGQTGQEQQRPRSKAFGGDASASQQMNQFALGANNEPIYDHGFQSTSEQALWFQHSEHIDLKDFIFNNGKAGQGKLGARHGGTWQQNDVYCSQKDQQVPLKMTYELHFIALNGV